MTFTIAPPDYGIARSMAADLRGGEPAENADAVRAVLRGDAGPHRDVVVLNAAAALVVAGICADLEAGLAVAAASIDDGRASATLERFVEVSQAQGGS